MLDCSNLESAGNSEIGNIHDLKISFDFFYFGDIRSSRLKKIEFINDEDIKIHTKNSIYLFRREDKL